MAAKKPKAPRKFKQARKAAVADAKGAFSTGKTKAYRKDPKIKISAEDEQILKDVKKEAKGNYITDDKGNKVFQKPTETAQERFARDRREAKDAIDRKYGVEEKAKKATTPTKTEAPAEKSPTGKKKAAKKAAPKKPGVKKPTTTKGYSAGKTLNATGQARYDALIKEGVSPKKAMNKALFAQEKATKPTSSPKAKAATQTKIKTPTAPKMARPTDASLTQMEDDYLKKTQEKLIKQGKLSGSKEVALRPKGEMVSTKGKSVRTVVAKPVPGSGGVVKKGSKVKKFVKGSAALAVGAEAVSLAKGSTKKDAEEIIRLKRKLADLQGKKRDNAIGAFREGAGSEVGQLASLVSFGLVGKTRRERMDELNAKIAKQQAKNNKGLRYGPNGESLVPGTDAYKKGSKTRPKTGKPAAGGAAGGSSGGSSGGAKGGSSGTTPGAGGTTSNVYVVQRGDNLSKIAKNQGVKLSELLAANTKFKTNAKYKGGNMIWAGTTVKLPKK
jgi:LysM repeat protein